MSDWSSLRNFPPSDFSPTFCEVEAALTSKRDYPVVLDILSRLPTIPKITTSSSSTGPTSACATVSSVKFQKESAFLSTSLLQSDSNRHKFIQWIENRIKKLPFLYDNSGNKNNMSSNLVSRVLMEFWNIACNLKGYVNPYSPVPAIEYIHEYSTVRDWKASPVRYLKWHPQTSKLALALFDDSIQIYCLSLIVSPILKYKQQRSVSCLAWRPFSSSELAVGCESGVLIWYVDPTSVVAKPSASCVSLLGGGCVGHKPVSSVAYDPQGKFLLSASPTDKSIILWNTWTESYVPLRRLDSGGINLVSWSPCGQYMMSSTTSSRIRIWNVRQQWKDEVWNVKSGHVNAAAWSPCGNYLLFSTTEDYQLFCINFLSSGRQTSVAVPVLDLTLRDEEVVLVQSIKWDSKGERLVISFKNSSFIALFCTTTKPTLGLTPIGFICGEMDEFPSTMDFLGMNTGRTILTVVWSSGRIQHIPLIFNTNLGDANHSLVDTSQNFKPELFSSPL